MFLLSETQQIFNQGFLFFSGVDVVQLLEILHVPDVIVENLKSDEGKLAGNTMAAFALYKVATPARYAVTVGEYTKKLYRRYRK